MATFFKKYKKRIALLCALILFVFASGYTSINSLRKSVEVKLNERETSSSEAESIIIENALYNKTLRELLAENDLPTSDDYVYGTDLDKPVREVDVISISKKINGTLTVDGKKIDYSSGADTVADVIDENDIELAASDAVDPALDSNLANDTATIRIYRQNKKRETREEVMKFETTQSPDPNIPFGTTVVDIPGTDGKKRITEDVTYRDGEPIKRELVEEEILLEPINQIERVGTGDPNQPQQQTPTVDNTNPGGTQASAKGSTPANNTGAASGTSGVSPDAQQVASAPVSSSPTARAASVGNSTSVLSNENFDLVCAIVQHESGGDYEGALAVMSCVMNRVDASGYPNDPVSVLTAPGQFASYLDGYYKQFLGGKSGSETKQAVTDCLNGKRNHNYLNFRSYQTPGSERIGGNWFF